MSDLKDLVRTLISEVKALESKVEEILKPLEETSSVLPGASGSLEDVIRFTEESVHRIMDDLEQINKDLQVISDNVDYLSKLSPIPSISSRLETIKIKNQEIQQKVFEVISAMSFQDLASQQIRKVIEVIENIKKVIVKIVLSSVDANIVSGEKKEKIVSKATEMLTGDRINQEDVDALLKELGL